MRPVMIFLAILCVLIVAVAVFVWSGVYNVAATAPHWNVTKWLMETVRERSISAHSREIIIPPLEDKNLVSIGFRHYHAMCRLCHNAPGYTRTDISRGLYPSPPEFSARGTTLPEDTEVFWVVKNGIKMTGMPAFGSTHSEKELLGIVFFVKRVPKLTPEEYLAMEKMTGLQHGEEHHH